MSENPPKKVSPEKQAEADARSKRNKEAALEVQKKGMPLRAEQAQRERVREGLRSRTVREYRQEKEKEDREVRGLHSDTKERKIDEFLDSQNTDFERTRTVKERLIRRNKAEEALRPVIDAKKATAAALRKGAGTTRSREARPKDLIAQAEVIEAEVAVLEQQLRDMILRPNKLKQESVAPKSEIADVEVDETSTVEGEQAAAEENEAVAAPEKGQKDRSDASPLEAIDERLKDLVARYGSSETPAAERQSLREEIKMAMAEREQLLSLASVANEDGVIEYKQFGEFTGNPTHFDFAEQLPYADTVKGSLEEEPVAEQLMTPVENVETPKAPRDPMGPNEDGKPIAMLNSVLYRQSMGIEKRSKRNEKKMEGKTFPADPRYGGSVSGVPEATVVEKQTTRTERLAKKKEEQENNKRRWLFGAGVLAASGLLALLNPWSKKEETTAVKQPERPAATRTAKDAGLKTPLVTGVWDTPSAVTVPARPETATAPAAKAEMPKVGARINAKAQEAIKKEVEAGNLREADAKMVMEWEHMAYRKAGEALPPDSDKRILSVVETIRANKDNPYAFKPVIARPRVEKQAPTAEPAVAPPAPVAERPVAATPAPTTERPAVETPPARPFSSPAAERPRKTSERDLTNAAVYELNGAPVVIGADEVARFELAQDYAKKNPGVVFRFFSQDPSGVINVHEVVDRNGGIVTSDRPAAEAGVTPPNVESTVRTWSAR